MADKVHLHILVHPDDGEDSDFHAFAFSSTESAKEFFLMNYVDPSNSDPIVWEKMTSWPENSERASLLKLYANFKFDELEMCDCGDVDSFGIITILRS